MSFSERYQRVLDLCSSPRYFGEPAFYLSKDAPDGTEPTEITGVPSREAIEVSMGEMVSSKGIRSTYGVNLVSLANAGVVPKKDDFLSLRNISFRIKEVIPDSEGGATLVLFKS